jgi:hypothetical protein
MVLEEILILILITGVIIEGILWKDMENFNWALFLFKLLKEENNMLMLRGNHFIILEMVQEEIFM